MTIWSASDIASQSEINKYWNLYRLSTVQWRLDIWSDALRMIGERPFFGHGPNTFMDLFLYYQDGFAKQRPTYAHNCALQIAVETGILGLICFTWILIASFKSVELTIRKLSIVQSKEKLVLAGLLSASLIFLIHSFFDTNFYSTKLFSAFWALMGIMHSFRINVSSS